MGDASGQADPQGKAEATEAINQAHTKSSKFQNLAMTLSELSIDAVEGKPETVPIATIA